MISWKLLLSSLVKLLRKESSECFRDNDVESVDLREEVVVLVLRVDGG